MSVEGFYLFAPDYEKSRLVLWFCPKRLFMDIGIQYLAGYEHTKTIYVKTIEELRSLYSQYKREGFTAPEVYEDEVEDDCSLYTVFEEECENIDDMIHTAKLNASALWDYEDEY